MVRTHLHASIHCYPLPSCAVGVRDYDEFGGITSQENSFKLFYAESEL